MLSNTHHQHNHLIPFIRIKSMHSHSPVHSISLGIKPQKYLFIGVLWCGMNTNTNTMHTIILISTQYYFITTPTDWPKYQISQGSEKKRVRKFILNFSKKKIFLSSECFFFCCCSRQTFPEHKYWLNKQNKGGYFFIQYWICCFAVAVDQHNINGLMVSFAAHWTVTCEK